MIGAALFLRGPERTCFQDDDLLVAAQLATHSAPGVDRTVLYGREACIAGELQRRMLPQTLPTATGTQPASRYPPGHRDRTGRRRLVRRHRPARRPLRGIAPNDVAYWFLEPEDAAPGQARATDEGGRGLHVVNRLARRWGATRLSTGKVIWFELGIEQ